MLADIGTTWAKILDENGEHHILQTQQILKEHWHFKKATGHLGKKFCEQYLNELEALGEGALKLISEDNFTILDIGSRDTKFLRFKNRKVQKLDWNQSCGASTGFTLELLMKYYDVNAEDIVVDDKEGFALTCAVFGMEKIFDSVIQGQPVQEALGLFIKSIAFNAYEFCSKPAKIYLSGGLGENPAFIKALTYYCDVKNLGRFVLLEGLK